MVEVFKTNVGTKTRAKQIAQQLAAQFATCRINFDLGDTDNIIHFGADIA